MPRGSARTAPGSRRRRSRETVDEATRYAEDIVAGRVVACTFVRQACERHLRDLRDGAARGLTWSVRHVERALSFVRSLRHTRGGRGYFNLQPWQAFIAGSIFGWRRVDGLRRYTHAYVEVPRKNGKSELVAAIALYACFFDDPVELGARGYSAATKKDQAREVFDAARAMIRTAPAHRAFVRPLRNALARADTDSSFQPVGADADTLDGINASFVVIDELHAHKTSAVVDVLDSGTGARAQPLLLEITTAGSSRVSICWQHHEETTRILDPASGVTADTWFGIIYCADDSDKWDDEATWRKANPNFGISVRPDWVRAQCERARRLPSTRDTFLQKILNLWRNVGDRAIQFATWDRGSAPFDPVILAGRTCWIGLDLARTRDLSSAVAVFPPVGDETEWYASGRHYCPEENIEKRSEEDRVPYRSFVASGHLIATPGEVTDLKFITHDLLEWAKVYRVRELVYDEVMAAGVVEDLADAGVKCVPQSQIAKAMILPTAEYLRLVESGRLRHGGDPVMRWTAGNLVVRKGATGETSPDKKKSRERIDPQVAAIMAVGRAVLDEQPEQSVYRHRGVRVIAVG